MILRPTVESLSDLSRLFILLFLSFLTVLPRMGIAQDGVPIRVGDSEVFPSLGIQYFSNSNVFLSGEENDEQTSTGVALEPELVWRSGVRGNQLFTRYRGNYQDSSVSAADFNDHELSLGGKVDFSRRSSFDGDVTIARFHQPLGAGFTRQDAENLNATRFTSNRIRLRHRFGAQDARGNLDSGLRLRWIDFRNNRLLTDGADRFIFEPSVRFSVRIAGSTRGFVGVKLTDLEFDDSTRDRLETLIDLGVLWNEAEKTGGSVALGATRANREVGEDRTELSIDASVWYLPRTYSRLEFSVERSFDEDLSIAEDGGVEVDIETDVKIDWEYDWSSSLSHNLTLSRQDNDSECPGNGYTNDAATFELNYRVKRWLELGVGVNGSSRDARCEGSGQVRNDYDSRVIFLGMRATL